MSSAKGLRQVGYFDCPGGGQIVVAGTTAFIGHMRASFLPEVLEGSQWVQSNDVTTDDRGLFYLLDRLRGLTILERCQNACRHVEPALRRRDS